MAEIDALIDTLGHAADRPVVRALDDLLRHGEDAELARVNALSFAESRGLDEDGVIGGLLHASRLGLFEMSWNMLCPSCSGVLDVNSSLKTLRDGDYLCSFCELVSQPRLDDTVEVSFAASPRVRRIAAHDRHSLPFWDYYRQVFFGTGVAYPEPARFAELARDALLETATLEPGERMILALTLPAAPIVIGEPVTHAAHFLGVEGAPTAERQDLAIVFDDVAGHVGKASLRPGPLRLSLDNRASTRVLPGIFVAGPAFDALIGGRRPYLTAKRLLSNQTFRDIYRTDTLDVDQRLKVMSLTFLFTDLKGSTELYQRVGDLVAYDLVKAHFSILTDIVASESGAVVKTIGDAVMATFPAPDQAVAAAIRMREAMRRLNAERGADELTLKIGMHEGPCLAVSLNDRQDYFGQTVNIASRVQQIATADAIYVTGAIVAHAPSAALFGVHGLKAVPRTKNLRSVGERIPVFELAE